MKFRWSIKELKETNDLKFAICILNERASELNMYCPLYKKIRQAVATIESTQRELEMAELAVERGNLK